MAISQCERDPINQLERQHRYFTDPHGLDNFARDVGVATAIGGTMLGGFATPAGTALWAVSAGIGLAQLQRGIDTGDHGLMAEGWLGSFPMLGGTSRTGRLGTGLRPAITAVGQEHHAISRTIHRALQRHQLLAGTYTARDPRFVTRAADAAAHRGYAQWHRQIDKEVVRWIEANPNATPAQFESYLRQLYSRSDLATRFPHGL